MDDFFARFDKVAEEHRRDASIGHELEAFRKQNPRATAHEWNAKIVSIVEKYWDPGLADSAEARERLLRLIAKAATRSSLLGVSKIAIKAVPYAFRGLQQKITAKKASDEAARIRSLGRDPRIKDAQRYVDWINMAIQEWAAGRKTETTRGFLVHAGVKVRDDGSLKVTQKAVLRYLGRALFRPRGSKKVPAHGIPGNEAKPEWEEDTVRDWKREDGYQLEHEPMWGEGTLRYWIKKGWLESRQLRNTPSEAHVDP
jgi:hypothetical protein